MFPSRYLSVKVGYYPDDGLLEQLDLDSLRRNGFREITKGGRFEAGLRSVLIGPCPFFVKEDQGR